MKETTSKAILKASRPYEIQAREDQGDLKSAQAKIAFGL